MNELWLFLKEKRNVVNLLVLAIIIVGLPVGVNLVEHQQNLLSHADNDPIVFAQLENVVVPRNGELVVLQQPNSTTVSIQLTSPLAPAKVAALNTGSRLASNKIGQFASYVADQVVRPAKANDSGLTCTPGQQVRACNDAVGNTGHTYCVYQSGANFESLCSIESCKYGGSATRDASGTKCKAGDACLGSPNQVTYGANGQPTPYYGCWPGACLMNTDGSGSSQGSCSNSVGSGHKYCVYQSPSSGGNTVGSCKIESCTNGANNPPSCDNIPTPPTVCTYGTTQPCSVNGGSGTQTCVNTSNGGTNWGSCVANPTQPPPPGSCTPGTKQACNNNTGMETCNGTAAGASWGACVPNSTAATCNPAGGIDPNTWAYVGQACDPNNPGNKGQEWQCSTTLKFAYDVLDSSCPSLTPGGGGTGGTGGSTSSFSASMVPNSGPVGGSFTVVTSHGDPTSQSVNVYWTDGSHNDTFWGCTKTEGASSTHSVTCQVPPFATVGNATVHVQGGGNNENLNMGFSVTAGSGGTGGTGSGGSSSTFTASVTPSSAPPNGSFSVSSFNGDPGSTSINVLWTDSSHTDFAFGCYKSEAASSTHTITCPLPALATPGNVTLHVQGGGSNENVNVPFVVTASSGDTGGTGSSGTPPTPQVVAQPDCFPSNGADVAIHWNAANPAVTSIQISTNPDFPNDNALYTKAVVGGATSITADGFSNSSGTLSSLVAGRDYYFRTYNGSYSDTSAPPFIRVDQVCSGDGSGNPPGEPGATTTVSFQLAEDPVALDSAPVQPYTADGMAVSHTFLSNQPGLKTIYVKFTDSTGATEVRSSSIEMVAPDPVINNIACNLDLTGSGVAFNLTGTNFGDQNGTITTSGDSLDVSSWTDQAISGVLSNSTPTSNQSYTLQLTRSDGQTVQSKPCQIGVSQLVVNIAPACNSVTALSSGSRFTNAQFQALDLASGALDNENVSIDSDGVIQGLKTTLTPNSKYKISVKAPGSLRRVTDLTASNGTSVLDFTLPLGDIYPIGAGDGAINSLDYTSLKGQWGSDNSSGSSILPGDLNQDTAVNSIDWACMRTFFNGTDDPALVASSSATVQ